MKTQKYDHGVLSPFTLRDVSYKRTNKVYKSKCCWKRRLLSQTFDKFQSSCLISEANRGLFTGDLQLDLFPHKNQTYNINSHSSSWQTWKHIKHHQFCRSKMGSRRAIGPDGCKCPRCRLNLHHICELLGHCASEVPFVKLLTQNAVEIQNASTSKFKLATAF